MASLCASDHFVMALVELLKSVYRCEELISLQRSLGRDPKFSHQGDRETAKGSSEPLQCSRVRMWGSGLTVAGLEAPACLCLSSLYSASSALLLPSEMELHDPPILKPSFLSFPAKHLLLQENWQVQLPLLLCPG